MSRRSKYLVAALSAVTILFAVLFLWLRDDCRPGELPAPVAKQHTWKPFIYRVEGKRIGYLFGTIHVSDDKLSGFPRTVLRAMEQSEAVYLEFDPKSSRSEAIERSRLPDGKSLGDIVPPDLLGMIHEEVKLQGLRSEVVDQLRPLGVLGVLVAGGRDKLRSVDKMVALFARKKVYGLETVEEQVGAFESLSTEDQMHMIRTTILAKRLYRAAGRDRLDDLVNAYASGDEDVLLATVHSQEGRSCRADERINERISLARSKTMAERIADKLAEPSDKSLFFAVGAAHLVGEGSIVQHLSDRGLKVSRPHDYELPDDAGAAASVAQDMPALSPLTMRSFEEIRAWSPNSKDTIWSPADGTLGSLEPGPTGEDERNPVIKAGNHTALVAWFRGAGISRGMEGVLLGNDGKPLQRLKRVAKPLPIIAIAQERDRYTLVSRDARGAYFLSVDEQSAQDKHSWEQRTTSSPLEAAIAMTEDGGLYVGRSDDTLVLALDSNGRPIGQPESLDVPDSVLALEAHDGGYVLAGLTRKDRSVWAMSLTKQGRPRGRLATLASDGTAPAVRCHDDVCLIAHRGGAVVTPTSVLQPRTVSGSDADWWPNGGHRVAWADGSFVVYGSDEKSAGWVNVSPDGTLRDELHPAPGKAAGFDCSGDTCFLVSVPLGPPGVPSQEKPNQYDIAVQRVSPSGALIDEKPVIVTKDRAAQGKLDVSWTGKEYAVAFVEGPRAYAYSVNTQGVCSGKGFDPMLGGGMLRRLGDGYLLVSPGYDHSGGRADIRLNFLNAAGEVIRTQPLAYTSSAKDQNVTCGPLGCLVSWNRLSIDRTLYTFALRVSNDGKILDDAATPLRLADALVKTFAGPAEYTLVLGTNTLDGEVFELATMPAVGVRGPVELRTLFSSERKFESFAAAVGGGKLLLVRMDDQQTIRAVVMEGAGLKKVSQDWVLEEKSSRRHTESAIWTGREFVVLFEDAKVRLHAVRLDPSTSEPTERVELAPWVYSPVLASNGQGQVLVGGTRAPIILNRV